MSVEAFKPTSILSGKRTATGAQCRLLCLLSFFLAGVAGAQTLTLTLAADDVYWVYLSTNDSVAGTLIGSGTDFHMAGTYTVNLQQPTTYYLHIHGSNNYHSAGFLGQFTLSDSRFSFTNGLQQLLTEATGWRVSATGFGDNYQIPAERGINGASPWGTIAGISGSAKWIWTADQSTRVSRYFSTPIYYTNTGAPFITVQPQSQRVISGRNVAFTVVAHDTLPASYQWRKNGTDLADGGNIAGATNSTLTITSVLEKDEGTYSVTVYNALGTVNSLDAVLTVIIAQPLDTLYTFTGGTNGAYPYAGLTLGDDGYFYGTTSQGGSSLGWGALFKMTPAGTLSTLASFNGINGRTPTAGLTLGNDGNFYGTARLSGSGGGGTVFKVTTSGLLTTLVSFNGTNGADPSAGLTLGNDGNFYGTTYKGGSSDYGTVFMMTPAGNLTTLLSFTGGINGRYPPAALTLGNDGNFYGTTLLGGGSDRGTVFRLLLPPVITVQPQSQTNNVGATVVFTVSATSLHPMDFQWRKNGTNLVDGGNRSGATNSTLTITSISDNDAGSYLVRISNENGSVTSTEAVLTVITPPTITLQPASVLVLAGVNVTYIVSVNGTTPSYQWQFNGANILHATDGSYAIASVGTNQAGNYSVVITNAAGSVTSSNATLTLVLSPESRTNHAGSTATFTATAVGPEAVQYQWRKNGTDLADGDNISGTTNSTLTIASVSDADAADYSAVVSGASGSVTTSNATLTVINPPTITLQPASVLVLAGVNVTYIVSVNGTTPSYQWQFNGANILHATDGSYAIASVGTNQAGNYSVVITNAAGSVTSSNAALTVVLSPESRTNHAGSTATFTATAVGPEAVQYQWRKNGTDLADGGNIAGATNSTLTIASVSDAAAADYSAVVSGASGSVTTSNALLVVTYVALFDDFEPGIDLTQWSAFGGTVGSTVLATNYGGSVSGTNSLWMGNPGSRFATTIAVNTTAGGEISFWLRIAAGASAPWEKADLPGEGIVLEYSVNGGVVWNNIGSYDTAAYNNWTLLQVPIPAGAQSGSTQFRWRQLSNSGTGFDHWAVDDVSILTGPQPPGIVAQPESQTVAVGATANFSVMASGTAPLSYQWRKGGENLNGATSSAYTISNVQTSDAGSYSVLVANAYGTATSSNATLTVSEFPLFVTQPQSQTVAVGSNVTFTAAAYGAPPLIFQWYFNDAPIGSPVVGTNFSSLALANVDTNYSGNYSVQVVNGYGSVMSSNATLTVVIVPPTIAVQPASQHILLGSGVSFAVSVNGTAPFRYQWRRGGSNILYATNNTYSIQAVGTNHAGNYSVVVTNSAGSVTSSNALLVVVVPPTLRLQLWAGYPFLSLHGMLNSNFVVEYSPELPGTNWNNLLSLTNLSVSPYQFLDPAVATQRTRFYRAFMQ